MFFTCYCQDQYPIEPLLNELKHKGIQYELKDHEGKPALWLADVQYVDAVAKAYESYKQASVQQKQHTLSVENIKQLPVTVALIAISLLVALVTQLGEQLVDYFFIAQIQYYPRGWIPYSGMAAVWHSISPIFLHFGVEHLVFNSLSFWYLGSVLERRLPVLVYIVLLLMIALTSNYSQLWVSGPLFGGLSGVVYGLIGFGFCYQKWIQPLLIPNGFLYLAIGWLVLGYTPFFVAVGLGNMANTAHLSGLLSGLIAFVVFYIFQKMRAYEY